MQENNNKSYIPNNLDPEKVLQLAHIKLMILDVDGVMTDGKVIFSKNGESKSFDVRDGLGIKLLQRFGVVVSVISARHSEATTARCENLAISHVYQGEINKLKRYEELKKKLAITDSQIIFIGDDIIDIPIFKRAGIAVCPKNSHHSVKSYVNWVSSKDGGDGAIREVCDAILAKTGGLQKFLNQIENADWD